MAGYFGRAMEGGVIRDEVRAAKKGVGYWGDFLEAKDENWRGVVRFGEGGEEVRGERGRVDGLAGAVESQDVRGQSGHC